MSIFDNHPETAGKIMAFARFYTKAVEDVAESLAQGRPVFRNEPFVHIKLADDPFNTIHAAVKDTHKRRWPREWAAYQASEQTADAAAGAPVEVFPLLKPATLATLKALGVHTIEALSKLEGEVLAKVGHGAEEIRDRARQFLQGESETVAELRREAASRDATITSLRAEIEQLRAKSA